MALNCPFWQNIVLNRSLEVEEAKQNSISMRILPKAGTALAVLLAAAPNLTAQENIGIANDNYSPVLGRNLNPSAIVDSKTWLDIQLVGVGAYARNNYAYLPSWQPFNFSAAPTVAYDTTRSRVWGYADAEVRGPAFSLSLGKHAVGLHTAARCYGTTRRLPGTVANAVSSGITNFSTSDSTYSVRNVRMKSMAWGEVGFTYGTILRAYNRDLITGAITVKRLFGSGAANFLVKSGTYQVQNELGVLTETSGKYAYAEPSFRAGRGWGADLGVTWKRTLSDATGYVPHSPQSGCESCGYRYKIGLSLLDVGAIRFRNNALQGSYSESSDPESFQDLLANGTTTDAALPRDADNFRASLPTALSLQVDYNAGNGWYLNGSLLQKATPYGWFGAERANLLSGAVRYERKWFTAALPVSLLDYSRPQVGLALRMGPLVVGSDHLLPFITRKNVKGADVYASLHIPLYKAPGCCSKGSGCSGGSKGTPSRASKSKRPRSSKRSSNGVRFGKGTGADCPSW